MIIQENPKTKQRFINLPIELCKCLEIRKGMLIEFKVIDKNSLEMNITRNDGG